jgi:serine/threonine-protein kinase
MARPDPRDSDPAPLFTRLSSAVSDRYRIERELGAGGMATVYLAADLRHRRNVAVKVLRPELAATLGPDRFLREIEVAANLQHPHILPLFDSGEADGFLYYVMPYVDGESLRERLGRSGELSVPDAAKILRDVVDALAYAHHQGVVHRDIKPDNVLLSGRHALVTDFGVAKAVSEATGRQSLTTAGVALGTPMYMAPEQAVADPHVDFRADLYAVGTMAYEMLTGAPPFTGASAQAILAAQVTEAPKPISSVRQTVPAPLALAVMQCLEKRPADRPHSAESLIPTLESLSAPSGGVTPASTTPHRAVQPAMSRVAGKIPRWALALGAVVILAGAGYGALRVARGDRANAIASTGASVAKSVAVLPFDNLGGDSANRTFTDGVHDEILTDLTRVAALQVTSRTSVEEYRDTKKSVQQIGAELGVGTLLEGQVQRAGNQVHVSVQLVDASRDRQLWANSYDRALTTENVFAIQGDIARRVAEALRANILKDASAITDSAPTIDLEALNWYHRGKELFDNRGPAAVDSRIAAAFQKAVELDSTFAEAWAGLAAALSWEVRTGIAGDTVPARRALDRAVTLAPSSAETELALAYYAYYAKGDYDDALTHFQAVAAARPSNVDAIAGIGLIAQRQGRFSEALQAEGRAIALDPRNVGWLVAQCQTYYTIRQFDRSMTTCRRAYILDPTGTPTVENLTRTLLAGLGDTAAARAFLDSASSQQQGPDGMSMRSLLSRWTGDYTTSDAWSDSAPKAIALDSIVNALVHGLNSRARGDARAAARYGAVAERIARAELTRSSSGSAFGHLADLRSTLGVALALQGRGEEAVAEGERALALNPASRDVIEAPRSQEFLIEIQLLLGENEQAIRGIVEQASRPAPFGGMIPITRASLRMDPLFTPVRNDPRIESLLRDDGAWVVKDAPDE